MVLFLFLIFFTPTLRLLNATSYLWVGLLGIREEWGLAWRHTAHRQGCAVRLCCALGTFCLELLCRFQFQETLGSIEIVPLEAEECCDFIGCEDFQSLN